MIGTDKVYAKNSSDITLEIALNAKVLSKGFGLMDNDSGEKNRINTIVPIESTIADTQDEEIIKDRIIKNATDSAGKCPFSKALFAKNKAYHVFIFDCEYEEPRNRTHDKHQEPRDGVMTYSLIYCWQQTGDLLDVFTNIFASYVPGATSANDLSEAVRYTVTVKATDCCATEGHSPLNLVNDASLCKAATCEENAVYYKTCEYCNTLLDETFEYQDSALGHLFTHYTSNNDETCCTYNTETAVCDREGCNAVDVRQGTIMSNHDWDDEDVDENTVVPATCTEEGYYETVVRCLDCGCEKEGSRMGFPISALGHAWDNGTITVKPTCVTEGIKEFKCTREGCLETKTETIPCTDEHIPEVAEIVAPTCESEGYTMMRCCNHELGCQYTEIVDIIPALGHDYVVKEVVEATCEDEGYTVMECSRCHDAYETDWVHPLEHTTEGGELLESYEPNCREDGYEIWECGRCHEIFGITTEQADEKYHDWAIRKRTGVCGSGAEIIRQCRMCDKTEILHPTSHAGHFVSFTPATCTEDGYDTYKCDVCGSYYYERTEAKLGHDWNREHIFKEPTCTEEGLKGYYCNNCGMTDGALIPIPVTGHQHIRLDEEQSTYPTLDEPGVFVYVCDDCGEIVEERIVTIEEYCPDSETGIHEFGEEHKTVGDDCQHLGDTVRTCEHCGYEEIVSTGTGYVGNHKFDGRTVKTSGIDCKHKGNTVVYCSVDGCTECITESEGTGYYGSHQMTLDHKTKGSDCQHHGNAYYKCKCCGETEVDYGGGSVGDHDEYEYTVKNCGKREEDHVACKKCTSDWIKGYGNIVQHDYQTIGTAGVCKRCVNCGDEITSHDYGEPVTDNTKVSTASGWHEITYVYTCKNCSHHKKEYVAEPCTFELKEIIKDTKATCTKDGEYDAFYKCKFCSATKHHYTERPALGHDMPTKWTVITKATCTKDGKKTRACKRSGCTHTETQVIKSQGHEYGGWKTTKKATCTQEGIKEHTCTQCGKTESQTIPIDSNNHNYEWNKDETMLICTRCGKVTTPQTSKSQSEPEKSEITLDNTDTEEYLWIKDDGSDEIVVE